jgi:hypothetical protein
MPYISWYVLDCIANNNRLIDYIKGDEYDNSSGAALAGSVKELLIE